MPNHTITYVQRDGSRFFDLVCRFTGQQYTATLATSETSEPLEGVFRREGARREILVAQRGSQRFRTGVFRRFADHHLAAWLGGEYEPQQQRLLVTRRGE